jgi:NAD(P)-dependent dehydrogenase (short-subunit alcohol dehydrogenase family)
MMEVNDRVVLLSGATRGIGAATAARLYSDGYRLSLGVRDASRVSDELRADTDRVQIVSYDAMNPGESAKSWVAAAIERFGRIDVLVNNAGVVHRDGFLAATEAQLDDVLTVNVKGPFLLTQEAWPHLKQNGGGKIIILASLGGLRVKVANSCVYGMSKHAVMAMAHSLRMLGWDDGIRVTAICPGPVNTDMMVGASNLAPEGMTQPDVIAGLVSHALTLPRSASIPFIPINAIAEQLY